VKEFGVKFFQTNAPSFIEILMRLADTLSRLPPGQLNLAMGQSVLTAWGMFFLLPTCSLYSQHTPMLAT
jgi:hypothetical protein